MSGPHPHANPLSSGIVAYDLVAPAKSFFTEPRTCVCGAQLPPMGYPTPFRRPVGNARAVESEHAACYRRAREKRLMALAAEHKQAQAEHQRVALLIDHPAVGAVLALHHPVISLEDELACDHCEEGNGREGTKQVAWPCPTYAAVRDQTEAVCAST